MARGGQGEGGCLILEGPAGVGKTRLLECARDVARSEGFRVLSARAGEREREYAWGVIRALFEPVLRSADAGELEEIWGGTAAPCRPLLEEGAVPVDGPPDSSFAIFNGFLHVARVLASEQPLLLSIDDLHWVDGPSLGFLEFLVRRIESEPIVVAMTLRPNEPGSDAALIASLIADPNGERLEPRALTESGSAAALRVKLGEDLSGDMLLEAHEVTGGNPLLLSEIARTLRLESGEDASSILPGTLTELGSKAIARSVDVRLQRAGPAGRELAEACAVLGEEALVGQAVELAGLEPEEADRAALALVRLEILRAGSRIQFVHPLVRATLYDSIAAPERGRLHADAIAILRSTGSPPERLAAHLLEVDPAASEDVVRLLRSAAVTAAAGGDSRTATLLMRRALAEPPPAGELTDVLVQLGAAELLVDGPSAVEHLEAAIQRIDAPAYLEAVSELLARALLFQERTPEAIALCRRTLRALADHDDPGLSRRIEAVLAEAVLIDPAGASKQDRDTARELLGDSVARPGDDYGSRALAGLSAVLGARELRIDAKEGGARARRAAEGGILIKEGMNGIAQLAPAQVLTMAGDYGEAIELLNESIRWDERYGSTFGHLSNLLFRGWANLHRGSIPEAIADTEQSLRMSRAYGVAPGVAWSTAFLAEALLEAADLERATAVLDAELPASEPIPREWHWIGPMLARARVRLAAGDAEGALEDARAAGRTYADNDGLGPTFFSWRPTASDALLKLDRADDAAALAEEELELARRWGAPRQVARALRALAATDEGRREQLLSEAVEVLEPSEARLELASALVELGAAMRRANRKSESREALRRGMDLAHAGGAVAVAERARSELRASGVRARRTALSGPGSLTESERRVVDLAVAGRTNREIAAELFVTVKTVEVHLSSAYRKLGIRGRRDLGAAMLAA